MVELWNGKGNKYIIECDGHDFHEKTKEQVEYDKKRERVFVSKGYKVLRYSGSELYRDFEKITNELFDIFSSAKSISNCSFLFSSSSSLDFVDFVNMPC